MRKGSSGSVRGRRARGGYFVEIDVGGVGDGPGGRSNALYARCDRIDACMREVCGRAVGYAVFQLHRHLPVLVLLRLLADHYWRLRAAFLARDLRPEWRAVVGLADDLVEWLELVGHALDIADRDPGLLPMLEIVGAVWDVLLGAAAEVA
ncbi:hypothetical protein BD413DRAFT_497710 [Trametes elegans]|nr:hypothetical protein BD413DRAFT_497710 [Trametes elegans]